MVTKKMLLALLLPDYLHFVGIFPILLQGHLALLEISGLLCSRFSTSARDTLGRA